MSSAPGYDGIGGPYESYGIVLGPNATHDKGTIWGDLSDCTSCHNGKVPRPVFCDVRPCLYDNSKTGAAIAMIPFPLAPGGTVKYAAFVGLDYNLAGADSPRGPWTVYSSEQMGQYMYIKMSTPSSLYSENPVVTRITKPDGGIAYIATFDTVSPTGGWAWQQGRWRPAGRGESYGFGLSYSQDGLFWNDGEDIAVDGGVRTPLGFLEETDGTYTLLFTRRFADCRMQRLPPGSRGDAANEMTMCANIYAASFRVEWMHQDQLLHGVPAMNSHTVSSDQKAPQNIVVV